MLATTNPHTPMSGQQSSRARQLRRDRIKGVIILVVVAAIMGLLFWLASLNGTALESIDYWPMMP